MLDFLLGMVAGKMLSSSRSRNADYKQQQIQYEQQQIQKVLEIGNAINLMGSTLPADTDITEAVKRLKVQFDAIDGSAIQDPNGRKNYAAVRDFFEKNGIV